MARQKEAAGLVRRLGSASPAEQLEAARGLEQLAVAPGGAQRIQRAGGVAALVRLLQQGGGSEEALQLAAATALARMVQQENDMASQICTAGAGRVVAQRLPSSRSPALTQTLFELLTSLSTCEEQQVADELAASPGCLQRLAQLATNPCQDPEVARMPLGVQGFATQRMALELLTMPALVQTHCSAVTAAAAPHAAALIQRLSPRAAAGIPQAWMEQVAAARLVALLACESAELTARMVAAGAVSRLVGLMGATSPRQLPLQRAAVAALAALVVRQPSAADQLAAIDGVTEVLVQLLASHPPPASCKQAWDKAEAGTSLDAAVLLWHLIDADHAALAGRAIAAGAVPELARVLRWGAPRGEWLGRQGLWEQEAETLCANACTTLLFIILWWNSRPSAGTSAAHAALPQLAGQVLQHSRSLVALRASSQLLALLRDPSIQSTSALQQGTAQVLRQLQPGSHPDRAAAIAALLSELAGEAQRQARGGSGAAAAAVGPSSSTEAAQQAGAQKGAVPAACAACHALPPAGRKFQVCAGCRAVRYCSPACQKAAWRSGHKVACRAAQGGAQGGA
jgi:hypothetical protein